MTHNISNAILQHSVSMMLGFLGPLQFVGLATVFIELLKTTGLIKSENVTNRLADFNVAMKDHAEALREVETPNIVQNITKSSIQINETTNEVTAYFFFTKNNIITAQLRGLKYFAFDSTPEMFKAVYVWNYALDTAQKSGSSQFRKRTSLIYFLDPKPAPMNLPHMDFTEIYQNVTIICHAESKRSLRLSSVKISIGCSVRFEHLTVCHNCIDVKHGGSAYLHQCNIGLNRPRMDSPPASLVLSNPTTNYNRRIYSGTVTFQECSLSPTIKRKWKPSGRAMIKKKASVQGLINGIHGHGTYKLTNGECYYGESKDGKRHGQGTCMYANEDEYTGEWKDGKCDGHGTYKLTNGEEYSGEWKDGKRHGKGTYKYVNGDEYSGEWKYGNHHGQGTLKYANGNEDHGEWKDGKRHGQDTCIYASGRKYSGESKDGKPHCQGTDGFKFSVETTEHVSAVHMVQAKTEDGKWKTVPMYESGTIINYTNAYGTQSGIVCTVHRHNMMEPFYTVLLEDGTKKDTDTAHITLRVEPTVRIDKADDKYHGQGTCNFDYEGEHSGEWKDDKRHGQCSWDGENGDKYCGEWKDGKYFGQGTVMHANGDVYCGGWIDGNHHGQGTYMYANGDEYCGEWKDNKRHGQGFCEYANGNKYFGEWKDDFMHGQGTCEYSDGDEYCGEWIDNKRHGQGTYKYANRNVYSGEWSDGKRNGQGTCKYADGGKFSGDWKDDKRHGQGKCKYAGGCMYSGEWNDGKRHGQGTCKYEDGSKYSGVWKDDKRHGKGKLKYADGSKASGEWLNDFLTGQGSGKPVSVGETIATHD
jgi:hypothetical protein